MALNRTASTRCEKVQAFPALAMALFEQSGLTGLIDSRFEIDPRIKLTPGNAVKALVGNMFTSEGRRPIYNVSHPFMSAPVDLMFGPKVGVRALGGRAFDRNLDRLFGIDLSELHHDCYSVLTSRYHLDSNLFNLDFTNFTIHSLDVIADRYGAAVPEWCGHAKDGHNERLVYTLLSMTDENGIVCYEKPYDGSTSDQEMDEDAIRYLSETVDASSSTIVADCKIATKPLVDLMFEKDFGFVTKCPDNFGNKVRSDIVYSVSTGMMDPSTVRDGWCIYDTDAEVDGRVLRFVAFRTSTDIENCVQFHRDQDLEEAESRFRRFSSKLFNCDIDARRAVDEALKGMSDNAYDVEWSIESVEVSLGYGHRGRPKKDEVPVMKTEYKMNVGFTFNEERAIARSQDRDIRVLITNLPRANRDADNIRFGATADTVLKTYLGQYRIEHGFKLMKDGMGMDRVYLHKPSRENAMMFVITLATTISDVIHVVLTSKGMDYTAENLAGRMTTLTLIHDREHDEENLDGPEALQDLFFDCIEALDIDPDHILH